MTRRALVTLASVLAAAPAASQRAAPTAAPVAVDIPFTRFVLGNGLTLLVHEDHKAPIVV